MRVCAFRVKMKKCLPDCGSQSKKSESEKYWFEWWPQKTCPFPEPVSVTLFAKRVFEVD